MLGGSDTFETNACGKNQGMMSTRTIQLLREADLQVVVNLPLERSERF